MCSFEENDKIWQTKYLLMLPPFLWEMIAVEIAFPPPEIGVGLQLCILTWRYSSIFIGDYPGFNISGTGSFSTNFEGAFRCQFLQLPFPRGLFYSVITCALPFNDFLWLSVGSCHFVIVSLAQSQNFHPIFFGYFEEEKYFRVLLSSISSPRLVMLLLLISTLIPKGPLFQAIKYDRLAPEFILPFSKKKLLWPQKVRLKNVYLTGPGSSRPLAALP